MANLFIKLKVRLLIPILFDMSLFHSMFCVGKIQDVLNLTAEDVIELLNFSNSEWSRNKSFDFDDPQSLSDQDYYNIVGLRKGTI